MRKREIDSKLEEIIDFSGVGSFIDTPVKRYSSGMHARLGFSVAAHLDPDILLVDEVLSVGDVQFQNRCVAKMKHKIKNGSTIIFVSHNLPAVIDLCPKTLLLHLGEDVFWGESKEASRRYMNLVSDVRLETGDGAVEIVHTSWDIPSDHKLRPGTEFEFKIKLHFRQAVSCPTFNLVVNRVNDNLSLYDVAAQELGLPSRNYERGECIVVSFKGKLNLLRGLYSIGFNLYLPSRAIHLLDVPSIYQFYVHENASFSGVADLACQVSEDPT
jgi:lipopolysaccharide transport system ATP-binding protein